MVLLFLESLPHFCFQGVCVLSLVLLHIPQAGAGLGPEAPSGRDMPVIWRHKEARAPLSTPGLCTLFLPSPGGARIEDSRGMRRGLLQAASCI